MKVNYEMLKLLCINTLKNNQIKIVLIFLLLVNNIHYVK